MSNLQMSLKKQWFEMTKSGIKTEDYREINRYWIARLVQGNYNWNNDIESVKSLIPNAMWNSGEPVNVEL